jgi:predicted DNA-binding protein
MLLKGMHMNTKQIVIRLDEKSYEDLKDLSYRSGLSVSYLVRTMIHRYLKSDEEYEKSSDNPKVSKFMDGIMLQTSTTQSTSTTNLHNTVEKMQKEIEELKQHIKKDKESEEPKHIEGGEKDEKV